MLEKFKVKHPKLYGYLFTVTTFSKILALSLFIILPFVGFYLGMSYQKKLDLIDKIIVTKSIPELSIIPSRDEEIINCPNSSIKNWEVYKNTLYNFCIYYPSGWNHGGEKDEFPYFSAPSGSKSYNRSDIGIRVNEKNKGLDGDKNYDLNLEDYVTKQAGLETGPARIPKKITKVVTESGITGIKVEWTKTPYSGNKTTYTTYFSLPNDKSKTLQIEGNEDQNPDVYNTLITSLSFIN